MGKNCVEEPYFEGRLNASPLEIKKLLAEALAVSEPDFTSHKDVLGRQKLSGLLTTRI